MKIAICDDESLFIKRLSTLILDYLTKRAFPCEICTFGSGEELIQSEEMFDIIFLDIQMSGMSGIQTAEILRRRTSKFTLVFISAFMEFAPQGYEVQAFRYLIKSDLEGSFPACMKAVLRHMGIHRKRVTYLFVDGEYSLYTDDIIYIESRRHVALFHTATPTRIELRLYEKLDNIQQTLPADEFVRIHKSFLLNLHYLDQVANYTAYLSSGITLPISQSRFAAVKREFFRYRGRVE